MNVRLPPRKPFRDALAGGEITGDTTIWPAWIRSGRVGARLGVFLVGPYVPLGIAMIVSGDDQVIGGLITAVAGSITVFSAVRWWQYTRLSHRLGCPHDYDSALRTRIIEGRTAPWRAWIQIDRRNWVVLTVITLAWLAFAIADLISGKPENAFVAGSVVVVILFLCVRKLWRLHMLRQALILYEPRHVPPEWL